jgi:hypothetical protein
MRSGVAVAVLWGALIPARAAAQAQTGDAAAAEAIFLQGRRAMESGDYPRACPKFAESQRLDPAAGTLMNLAACEEKVGKLASAWQHWKEAIDALPAKDDRIAFAHSRVIDLERRLSWLAVTLTPGADSAARVFRDDIELGRASQGVPLPVDSGVHTITVLAPGRLAERVAVSVDEAEQKTIEVRVGAPAPAPARSEGGARIHTAGWIVAGLGAAGVVTAAVTGIWLVNVKSTVDANCPDHACVNQKGLDAVSTGKALVIANTAGIIAGAAGLGVGAYLILSHPRASTTTAIAPNVAPGQLTLSCVGTF